MTSELVFTLVSGTVSLAAGGVVHLNGGDPIVPSRLADGELERLTRIDAVGAQFVPPPWFTPPQLAHRQYVGRAMGLEEEATPLPVEPLLRPEIGDAS